MPENEESSEFFVKWERARSKVLKDFCLIRQLIMAASVDFADTQNLKNSMPHEIIEYYIAQMIKLK